MLDEILRGVPFEEIAGVAFKDKHGLIMVNSRPPLLDLASTPVINRKFFEEFPRFNLITSRGCPHNCAFCASPILCNRIVRFEPMWKVMKEMMGGFKAGHREFHFLDDQFLINEQRAQEFLSIINKFN